MTGSVWRTPCVRVEEVRVPARTRLRGHGHDAAHLCFLGSGLFEERHAGGVRTVEPGTLRVSPAGDEHDLTFRAESRCLLVLFVNGPGATEPPRPGERSFVTGPRVSALADRLAELLTPDRPDRVSALDVEALALELWAGAGEPGESGGASASPAPWLRRVRERIRDRPDAAPGTEDLAADAGYHPVYVARAFRRSYGLGIGEYARLVRAEHARRLLVGTDLTLSEVALRAGYADQSHLTRTMRRFLGTTPGRLRRARGGVVEVSRIQDPDSPSL